jgi:apolipoprotein N-acyltransferase
VENRRFILQAAATGVSGIVDPWGRVTEKIEIGTEGFASGMITPNRP